MFGNDDVPLVAVPMIGKKAWLKVSEYLVACWDGMPCSNSKLRFCKFALTNEQAFSVNGYHLAAYLPIADLICQQANDGIGRRAGIATTPLLHFV